MNIRILTFSINELQEAVREYAKNYSSSQPEEVEVDNGYGKIVLSIPLKPGTVISGLEFQRQTTEQL